MPGYRYVLELPDRSPADPAMFNTALPPGMWMPGDTFIAASDLRQFRIVEIAETRARARFKTGRRAIETGTLSS